MLSKLSTMLARMLPVFTCVIEICYARYAMYLTGQHNIVPDRKSTSEITHVLLAFMNSDIFNDVGRSSWPLFTSVAEVRTQFAPQTAVMVAIGGWGDTKGFELAARNESTRKLFAHNIKEMVDATGADGIDLDWEYPGGNGEDYKLVPNWTKRWEIDAYPLLLAQIRSTLGPAKLISAAVPGLPRDMLAFTKETVPLISNSVDFFNVMTYDLMNRRDNVTSHHTGVEASLISIDHYHQAGMPVEKMNLGFAFYLKWFKTDPNGGCDRDPIGCKTVLMEDPVTGADLGQVGGFSWHDGVPEEVSASYDRAMAHGKYDTLRGGQYYWDDRENLWWTWDTPQAILKKFPLIVKARGLGGVFAWGLGEDAIHFSHLQALNDGVRELASAYREKSYDFCWSSYDSSQGNRAFFIMGCACVGQILRDWIADLMP